MFLGLMECNLGWTVNDNFDSSNQAHIQLAQKTIDGTRLQTDNRDFADVRSGGLLTGTNFNVLDYIRPLSRTILHEVRFFLRPCRLD
jgi:hypothetical protein